jgi:hypothetical protein
MLYQTTRLVHLPPLHCQVLILRQLPVSAHLWDTNPMRATSPVPSQSPMGLHSLSSGSAAALTDESTSLPASLKKMASTPISWSSLHPLTHTPALQWIPSPSGSTKSSLATTWPTTLSTLKYLAYLHGSTSPKLSASDSWMTAAVKSGTSSLSWAQNLSWLRIASLCATTAWKQPTLTPLSHTSKDGNFTTCWAWTCLTFQHGPTRPLQEAHLCL